MRWGVKQWIISGVSVVVLVLFVMTVKTIIKNEVSKHSQILLEEHAQQLGDIRLQCEAEKLNKSVEQKKRIVELESELVRIKILLEKLQKQEEVTDSIKKDVRKFMKEFDELVGTKGKTDEKSN